jgi:hypothetical protein
VALLFALAGEKAAYAQAQQFGDQGQLTITAENLFGVSFNRVSAWNDTQTASNTSTHYGFLYSSYMGSSNNLANLSTPRGPWIGGHYFIIPNLSIGGTLGYEATTQSQTTEVGGTSTTTKGNSTNGFVILPKAGYSLVLSPIMAFWFRGGLGFTRRGTSSPNNDNNSAGFTAWFLSADALFVVTPVHAVGFYVGPQGNLSFTGSLSSTTNGQTTSIDASFQSFSIDVGVLGNFNL